MCGICGKLTPDRPVPADLIARMNRCLAHRGPDDEGLFTATAAPWIALGQRRLAILDLSPAGHQPMSNAEGNIWITFNGEIYNFLDLREELEKQGRHFRSRTDTEVLLHLYETEGVDFVRRLNGMFAFALWDSRKQRLLLARDPLGIKPLLYAWDGHRLAFASELEALLQDNSVSRALDLDALNLYLSLNYIPAPWTIFKQVRKLRPGHRILWEKGALTDEPFWDLPSAATFDRQNESGSLEGHKRSLFSLLENAVRRQMIADVPLGAFLSGGLDSSVVVAIMARLSSRPIKTYTIGYADMPLFDETAYARAVADMHGTEHHEISLTSQAMLDVVPDVLEQLDEPFGDSSAVPTYVVSRETARDVKVALSGDGGDELFAGYRMYKGEGLYRSYVRLPRWARRGLIEPVLTVLPESRDSAVLEKLRRIKKFLRGARATFEERFYAWNELFPEELRRSLLANQGGIDFSRGQSLYASRLQERQDDPLNRMMYADLKESLPGDMLRKVDAMSMRHALEVRVPLLDVPFAEYAFSLPGDMKLRGDQAKYVFRETFRDILPPLLHNRPKWGFEIPISAWLKKDLRFLLEDHLAADMVRRQGLFDAQTVRRLVADFLADRGDAAWKVWNLIAFQVWYRRFIGRL